MLMLVMLCFVLAPLCSSTVCQQWSMWTSVVRRGEVHSLPPAECEKAFVVFCVHTVCRSRRCTISNHRHRSKKEEGYHQEVTGKEDEKEEEEKVGKDMMRKYCCCEGGHIVRHISWKSKSVFQFAVTVTRSNKITTSSSTHSQHDTRPKTMKRQEDRKRAG